uniref:Uncharacterized protein n=1 Tax=Glossina palpalis gambiensis TaxID=67801 RepID=A0A1B0C203_9MUSC
MYNLSEDILKDPDLPKNQERLSGNVGKDVTIKSKEVPNSSWFLSVEFITRCEICDITAVGIPAILARSSPITSALIDIPHYVRVWPSSENQECGPSQTMAERGTQSEPAAGATYINCTSVFGKASASEPLFTQRSLNFAKPSLNN